MLAEELFASLLISKSRGFHPFFFCFFFLCFPLFIRVFLIVRTAPHWRRLIYARMNSMVRIELRIRASQLFRHIYAYSFTTSFLCLFRLVTVS